MASEVALKPANEDLVNRAPVWDALSELFLDTELELHHLERISSTLAASPYSAVEIESILYDEVYPVCIWNLRTVAGEWNGFDSELLHKAILNTLRAWPRLPRWMQMGHWMIRQPWEQVKGHFVRYRQGAGEG
jgi:hypothetical protein